MQLRHELRPVFANSACFGIENAGNEANSGPGGVPSSSNHECAQGSHTACEGPLSTRIVFPPDAGASASVSPISLPIQRDSVREKGSQGDGVGSDQVAHGVLLSSPVFRLACFMEAVRGGVAQGGGGRIAPALWGISADRRSLAVEVSLGFDFPAQEEQVEEGQGQGDVSE